MITHISSLLYKTMSAWKDENGMLLFQVLIPPLFESLMLSAFSLERKR